MDKNGITLPLKYRDLQSKKYFAVEPPKTLYHYTDTKGANGIITSKSLWLTKIQYLNDKSELCLAIEDFGNIVKARSGEIEDKEKIDFLNEVAKQLDSFRSSNLCIASFCENYDLLSQWRGYGKLGNGIALGFSSDLIRKSFPINKIFIWKCVYDIWQHEEIITDLINNLLKTYDLCKPFILDSQHKIRKDIIGYFNTLFLTIAPIIKNNHFSEEKEWRIILPQIECTDKDYLVAILNDRIIQYYDLKFPATQETKYNFLDEIVIGPSNNPELIGSAFHVLLNKNSISCKVVRYSQIPYRYF